MERTEGRRRERREGGGNWGKVERTEGRWRELGECGGNVGKVERTEGRWRERSGCLWRDGGKKERYRVRMEGSGRVLKRWRKKVEGRN